MIEFFLTITIAAISLLSNGTAIEKIIPLKSDQAEVEKLLGKPKERECTTCTYETETDFIVVHYAIKRCEGKLPGWNVPAEVVLTFTTEPKKRLTLETIRLRTEDLILRSTDDASRHYIDLKKGLKYIFNAQLELKSITRSPIDSDNPHRCKGFPQYNLAASTYIPIESFESIDADDGVARIQNNLIGIRQSSMDMKLHALVYAGENLQGKKFDKYITKLRKGLKNELSAGSPTLKIILAGKKRKFRVDIFFLKKNDPPPVPVPDFAS